MKSLKPILIILALCVYGGLAYVGTHYAAGAGFFLLNKRAPEAITITTWRDYKEYYADDAKQSKRLKISLILALVLTVGVPLIAFAKVMEGKERSLHGDARFATRDEIKKSGLLTEESGIVIGKNGNDFLVFPGQEFVLLAAPTRSGKGVSVVIPNLLNFPDSVVVLDLKIENFRLTSKFREMNGQQVFLFAPFSEDGVTHRWNVFDNVNRDPRFVVGDILAIANALYPADGQKDTFWNEQASNLFLGLALYLIETPELPCTLGEILRQSSGRGQPIKDYLHGIMESRAKSEMPLSGQCVDALSRFCATSDNTMSSIVATFNAPLTVFSSPILDAATSGSDFNLADVRKKRMSIYIGIQPNRLADASKLVNLFFSQLVNLNTSKLPQDDNSLKHQCLLILDEFTAIGKVGIIAKSVSFIAGYNLRLLPIIQSVAQLESVYGEKDTRTFVTNHAVQIIFPPREQKDANEYSEMLGYMTQKSTSTGISRPRAFGNASVTASENVSDQRRALMLPQELKELGEDKQIIIKENCKPILCEKARYFNDTGFMERLKSVSRTLSELAGKKLPDYSQLKDVAFVRKELSSSVPTIDISLHLAQIERRTRELKDNEEVKVNELSGIDTTKVVQINDKHNPTNIEEVVDSWLGQLEWMQPEPA